MKYIKGVYADPKEYVLIDSKDGLYWRKKRSVTPGVSGLNDAMQADAGLTRLASPAAARLRQTLKPWLAGLEPGRLHVKLTSMIKRGMKEGVWPDYSLFRDLDFQPEHPFDQLVSGEIKVTREKEYMGIQISIPPHAAVNKSNGTVDSYRFVLLMVAGNPADELGALSTESKEYSFEKEDAVCILRLAVPGNGVPWLACLRVVSYENGEPANHPKHHGMKVVGWG